ncbi:MAG: hypothetical protein DRP63_06700, partial [Planctomycetota bacterium]
MRLDADSLLQDAFKAAHSFLGGRVTTLVVVMWAVLGAVFVATYGQRLPGEPYPPPSLCAGGVSDVSAPHRLFVSVFVQPSLIHLAVAFFVVYLVMWFVARRMGVVLSLVTVILSGGVANEAAAALASKPV